MGSYIQDNKELINRIDEDSFSFVFETLPVPVFLLDKNRRIRRVNKLAKKIFSTIDFRERDLCLGKAFKCVNELYEDTEVCDGCVVKEIVNRVFETGDIVDKKEVEIKVKGGGSCFLILSASLIELEGMKRIILYIDDDITRDKETKENLDKLYNEMLYIPRLTTMGELTAGITHEIKQPLTAILTNAKAGERFLEDDEFDFEEIKDIIGDIIKDSKRANQIISRVYSLFKKAELDFSELDINDVIKEVLDIMYSDMIIKNIDVELLLSHDVGKVYADRLGLQQLLLNLLINSVQAMKDKKKDKKIVVNTYQDDTEFVTVAIKDSGKGINDKNIDKLFNSFFSLKEDGLGIGLSINKKIIERHKGLIWAEKNSGQDGMTFYFKLPVY